MLRRPKASKSRRNSERHHRSHLRKLNHKKKATVAKKKNAKKQKINIANKDDFVEQKQMYTNNEPDQMIHETYGNEGQIDSHFDENLNISQIEGNVVSYILQFGMNVLMEQILIQNILMFHLLELLSVQMSFCHILKHYQMMIV